MPKLPQISGPTLIRVLKKEGWAEVGQKGSHKKLVRYSQPIGKAIIIIPQHKVLKKSTLSIILKRSGLTAEKLKKLL